MKAKILGARATVQISLCRVPRTEATDSLQTYGRFDWIVVSLLTKTYVCCFKGIAGPQQIALYPLINDFVIHFPFKLRDTHYFKKSWVKESLNVYNATVCYETKEVSYFVRNLSTAGFYQSAETAEIITQKLRHLRRFSKKNNIDKVNKTVKFLLNNPNFWVQCYKSLEKNFSVWSFDRNLYVHETAALDETHFAFFQNLSLSFVTGNFCFGPTRAASVCKRNGSSSPLKLTDLKNKIVQQGLAIILEELSRHLFVNNSFGLQKNRSAKDALAFVKKQIYFVRWAIEGNVSQCFDRFKHKRLVSLIKKKYVSDQVFIDLLFKALKMKIIDINSFLSNRDAQTSILNPILFNIFLHEFDAFITKGDVIPKYYKDKFSYCQYNFAAFFKFSKAEMQEMENIKKMQSKWTYWKLLSKLKFAKLQLVKNKEIKRLICKNVNRKITYVRFVDNFIIFVWGTKNDCLKIKKFALNFLKSNLCLNLPCERMSIINLKKNRIKFLGFEIWQSSSFIPITKKDINFLLKRDKNLKVRNTIFQNSNFKLRFAIKSILEKLRDQGLVDYKKNKFYSTSCKVILQYQVPSIINYLKGVFYDISSYYNFVDNWYDAKSLYNYFGFYCSTLTVAHKTNNRITKVFDKYSTDLSIKDGQNKTIVTFGSLTNTSFKCKTSDYKFLNSCVINLDQLFIVNLRTIKK